MMPLASQFGGTAGADAIWWKTDVSSTQWLMAPIPPDDDQEEGPAQHPVDDDRRGPWPYPEGQHSEAQDDDRRRHEVDAGHNQCREAQSGVLGGGSEPGEDAGTGAAQDEHDERHEEPPAEPRRARHRAGQEVVEHAAPTPPTAPP